MCKCMWLLKVGTFFFLDEKVAIKFIWKNKHTGIYEKTLKKKKKQLMSEDRPC